MGFLIQGESSRGAGSGAASSAMCACGGRGCIEACLAGYALHRDAHLIDHRPAPAVPIPGEDAMATLRKLVHEAREVPGDAAGILIQTLEPDHIVICGPGTRAMDLLRPSFEAALESQAIPELRGLATIRGVESSMDLLTEGAVIQALGELESDLGRLKAA